MRLARNAPSDPKGPLRERAPRLSPAALVMLLLVLPAGPTAGQGIDDALAFEDLGFTRALTPGARVSGLAGAYTSAADDVHALLYNPAGLTRVKRVELGLGLQRQRDNLDNRFLGNPTDLERTSSTLDFIAGAYPLVTYRGSFVVALGAYRILSTDLDVLTRGSSTITTTNGDYRMQQSGDIFSYNFGAGLDVSPYLSVGANLFFLDGTVEHLTQFSFDLLPPPAGFADGDPHRQSVLDEGRGDLDGFGATLGFQVHPHPLLRLGVSINTPTLINLDRSSTVENIIFFFNALDDLETSVVTRGVDYRLPLRVTGGVSYAPRNFLLSAELGYADWTEATIDGKLVKDRNLRSVFRKVVSVRGGIEYTIPGAPIRLRGGYAYTPDPLRYLQSDRIEDWCRTMGTSTCLRRFGTTIEKARVETERQMIAGGVGVLVGSSLMIDASYESVIGKKAISTLQEERASQRVLVSTAYRF
ncbi:MAG: OmpP1/FadL family transporter [Candidatus Krumholzibacteriia bacterium]